MPCTVSKDRKPGSQARLEKTRPRKRFSHATFHIQSITPKIDAGNTKVIAIIDVFTWYVRALAIPDDKGEIIAKIPIDDWISIFGPRERLLSDCGPNLTGAVVGSMAPFFGIKCLKTYPFHPQANGTIERWNRTLIFDIASFMSTGISDWD